MGCSFSSPIREEHMIRSEIRSKHHKIPPVETGPPFFVPSIRSDNADRGSPGRAERAGLGYGPENSGGFAALPPSFHARSPGGRRSSRVSSSPLDTSSPFVMTGRLPALSPFKARASSEVVSDKLNYGRFFHIFLCMLRLQPNPPSIFRISCSLLFKMRDFPMSILFVRPGHWREKAGCEWIRSAVCEKRKASFFFCSRRESDVYSLPFIEEQKL
jgi:hypothetical protein